MSDLFGSGNKEAYCHIAKPSQAKIKNTLADISNIINKLKYELWP